MMDERKAFLTYIDKEINYEREQIIKHQAKLDLLWKIHHIIEQRSKYYDMLQGNKEEVGTDDCSNR